ncbi:hypothetical protein CONLIGDRAFT_184406 [Coniochaeta ligniaria NRRL 30616]|uniref:Uncharacterized protein n=1 Tax=Coniochaeta ligniaria NRRL 30616 TaxID=1408157 RepID=A0A1J7K0E1_9PEZI|nr:hypothetical protein CONLIGDRAFT_184406 [Coniochaeta ligniaria NRRL 30616]
MSRRPPQPSYRHRPAASLARWRRHPEPARFTPVWFRGNLLRNSIVNAHWFPFRTAASYLTSNSTHVYLHLLRTNSPKVHHTTIIPGNTDQLPLILGTALRCLAVSHYHAARSKGYCRQTYTLTSPRRSDSRSVNLPSISPHTPVNKHSVRQ